MTLAADTLPENTPPNGGSLSRKHVILLFLLYFSQGLPFGFQATALPVYLRESGLSLTLIGFAGLLSLPWMLKPLFAPFVDRYYSKKAGKRRSWIIPMQTGLLLSALFAGSMIDHSRTAVLLAAIFAMNFFAAIQDIAVDGLAVDLLSERELGPGNAAQVIGYKAGMIVSGGLLVFLTSKTGWHGMFMIMAALILLPLWAILLFRETPTGKGPIRELTGFREMTSKILAIFKGPNALLFLTFIATYKTGELMIDVMFKPFLVDSGFAASEIGLWVGTYGMAASIAGSFTGGAVSKRYSLSLMLKVSLCIRMVPLMLEWMLTQITPSSGMVIGVTLLEHFAGGMLTTLMFAFMMGKVDKSIGATHYTVLAAVEVIGKSPGAWLSGPMSDLFGYSPTFLTGIALSLVPIVILHALNKHKEPHDETLFILPFLHPFHI